jgi:hypothetical protein
MVADQIFDFFGTLAEYDESRLLTDNISSCDYICQLGFDKSLRIKQIEKNRILRIRVRRYCRRWRVEGLFAWRHNFRRIVVRYEYHVMNYQSM